jgi:SPP1 family phage portal protein
MIKLNYTKQDLQNENVFVEVIRKALELHTLDVIDKIREDKAFYEGTIPNVTYKINKSKYIVDMATEMFIGELPDITTYSEREIQRKRVGEFKKKIRNSDFGKELYDAGLNASKTGSGFLLTYTELGDTFPRYVSLDPELTNVVYDCSVKPKPLFAFTLLRQTEYNNNSKVEYYRVYIYTDTNFYNLRTVSVQDLNIANTLPLYTFQDGTEIVPHQFGIVPLIEFKNNVLLKGDARPVYGLISAYNNLQNNRITNVDDMVKYVLMLKNVRIGNQEEQDNFTTMLKDHRVLALEGDNADAKFLQNALDQTDLQRLVDDIEAQIEIVSRVPNFNSAEFAQNSSEPALKLKLKSFLDLAKEKERHFTTALSEVLGMTLDFVRQFGGREAQRYVFDMNDVEIEYSHNLPSNDMDKITQLVSLNTLGLLNPRVALQELSWIKNVDEYMMGIVPIGGQQAQNLANGGNNETNRLRQALATTNPTEIDNRLANTQGVAQTLANEVEEEEDDEEEEIS